MLQLGMRAHDFAPAMPAEPFIDGLSKANIRQIQLAFEKSFSDLDVSTGHYSAGLAQYISGLLHEKHVHCAVLGCYINPVVPDEALRKKEVDRFVERLRYAKHMGADMVGTETGRFSIDFSVTEKTNSEECYRVLLESFSKICAAAEALGVTVGVEGVFDHTLYSPAMMKRFLEDMLDQIKPFVFGGSDVKADIYAEEKEYGRLFGLIETCSMTTRLDMLMNYALGLPSGYAPALLKQCVTALELYVANNLGRNHYSYMARILRMMQKLDGGKEVVQQLVGKFREQYKRRRAMMEELAAFS